MSRLCCVSMLPKLPMCCWFSRLWTFFGPCSEVESNTGECRGGGGSRGHRRQLVWRPRLATTAPPAPPPPPPAHMCHKHGTRLSTTTTQHTGVCGKCLEESRLSVAATIPRVTKGVEPHCSLQTNSTFGDHLHFTRHPFKSFMKHETPRGCQTANSEAQLYIYII